eukprot:Rhum_TRINITY_DN14326_c26_g1::Rhum_TRINITY_DN14326_c26_g1_i1::g.85115::m.85115
MGWGGQVVWGREGGGVFFLYVPLCLQSCAKVRVLGATQLLHAAKRGGGWLFVKRTQKYVYIYKERQRKRKKQSLDSFSSSRNFLHRIHHGSLRLLLHIPCRRVNQADKVIMLAELERVRRTPVRQPQRPTAALRRQALHYQTAVRRGLRRSGSCGCGGSSSCGSSGGVLLRRRRCRRCRRRRRRSRRTDEHDGRILVARRALLLFVLLLLLALHHHCLRLLRNRSLLLLLLLLLLFVRQRQRRRRRRQRRRVSPRCVRGHTHLLRMQLGVVALPCAEGAALLAAAQVRQRHAVRRQRRGLRRGTRRLRQLRRQHQRGHRRREEAAALRPRSGAGDDGGERRRDGGERRGVGTDGNRHRLLLLSSSRPHAVGGGAARARGSAAAEGRQLLHPLRERRRCLVAGHPGLRNDVGVDLGRHLVRLLLRCLRRRVRLLRDRRRLPHVLGHTLHLHLHLLWPHSLLRAHPLCHLIHGGACFLDCRPLFRQLFLRGFRHLLRLLPLHHLPLRLQLHPKLHRTRPLAAFHTRDHGHHSLRRLRRCTRPPAHHQLHRLRHRAAERHEVALLVVPPQHADVCVDAACPEPLCHRPLHSVLQLRPRVAALRRARGGSAAGLEGRDTECEDDLDYRRRGWGRGGGGGGGGGGLGRKWGSGERGPCRRRRGGGRSGGVVRVCRRVRGEAASVHRGGAEAAGEALHAQAAHDADAVRGARRAAGHDAGAGGGGGLCGGVAGALLGEGEGDGGFDVFELPLGGHRAEVREDAVRRHFVSV